MKRDAVVSFAAGESQLPLIRGAKARGLAVLGVDRDPSAAALVECDAHVPASTHDALAVHTALAPFLERFAVRAVVSQSSGPPVAAAARVARGLGLPGLDPERARRSISKPGFASLCAAAGLPTPDQRPLRGEGDLVWVTSFPAVLKPSSSPVGKRGVILVPDADALPGAYARARDASEDGVVQAQEFVPGDDVALALLFREGELAPVALMDEHVRLEPGAEAQGLGFAVPSRFAGTAVEERAWELARRFVRELGTGVGFLALRARADGELFAIETHLDLAGDYVADGLLRQGAGFDLVDATLSLHLEGELPARPELRPASLYFEYDGAVRTGYHLEHLR